MSIFSDEFKSEIVNAALEEMKDIPSDKLEMVTSKISDRVAEKFRESNLSSKRFELLVQSAVSSGDVERLAIRKGRGGGIYFKSSLEEKKRSLKNKKTNLANGNAPSLDPEILERVESNIQGMKETLEEAKKTIENVAVGLADNLEDCG